MKRFPFNYEKPKKFDKKTTFYLTISAIIADNNADCEVFKIQKDLLKDIETTNKINSGIYYYPKNRIHFSIINFEDFSTETENEEKYRADHLEEIDKIKKIVKELNGNKSIIPEDRNVELAYIYTCKSDSIAVQAFPSHSLINYFNKIKTLFGNMGLGNVIIKGYPDDKPTRFPINIARFFREASSDEYSKLKESIQKYNDDFLNGDKYYEIKLKKLSFVVSDNWLSNGKTKEYEIESINLN